MGAGPKNVQIQETNKCSESVKTAEKGAKLYSKLTLKTLEQRHLRRSGVFAVNFEQILHLFLLFPMYTLNRDMLAGKYFSVV